VDGWRADARAVRSLQRVLELRIAAPGQPMPESRAAVVALLLTVRDRLRGELLSAEGVDPRSGCPTD